MFGAFIAQLGVARVLPCWVSRALLGCVWHVLCRDGCHACKLVGYYKTNIVISCVRDAKLTIAIYLCGMWINAFSIHICR